MLGQWLTRYLTGILSLPSPPGRVSLIDYRGNVIYDTYVQPSSPIISYRTTTTGLNGTHFVDGNDTMHLKCLLELTFTRGDQPFLSKTSSWPSRVGCRGRSSSDTNYGFIFG